MSQGLGRARFATTLHEVQCYPGRTGAQPPVPASHACPPAPLANRPARFWSSRPSPRLTSRQRHVRHPHPIELRRGRSPSCNLHPLGCNPTSALGSRSNTRVTGGQLETFSSGVRPSLSASAPGAGRTTGSNLEVGHQETRSDPAAVLPVLDTLDTGHSHGLPGERVSLGRP